MAMVKPTILLLHGCFSTPATFNLLLPYLEKAGYSTLTATFPSSNPTNPQDATAQNDITFIRKEYLLPLIEEECKDVVLVVHSYGGVVGASAAVGLSKAARSAQGQKGGIAGLIFIAANITHLNQTLVESAGGQWPPWLIRDKPHNGLAVIEPLMETLCHDCDPSLEAEVQKGIVPHGYYCLETKPSAPCWAEEAYHGRLAYIRTIQDKINPVFAQDLWIKGTGVDWDITSMDTSHAPHLSQPAKLTEHIVEFTRKFEAI